jgi:hypothetical protein
MDSSNSSDRPQTPPPPSAPSRTNSTRDQRLQAQTLHDVGFTCSQISNQLSLSLRQVRYTLSHRITPKKHSGRPSLLTQEEVDNIIA